MSTPALSRMQLTVATNKTDYWNDSCSVPQLTYGISQGAVGATTNPTIVLTVLRNELPSYAGRLNEIIAENPTWSENEIAWKLIEEMAVTGARLLLPIYERYKGKKGRLSIQTNPANYRSVDALVDQAVHFDSLAPNMQVKLPVTSAGLTAIEEATFRGVSVNATVSFTVPQAIAVAEAIERGLNRREAAGLDSSHMSPICTIMTGRNDDWMQVVARRDNIEIDHEYTTWAGIAVFKKAYAIYQQRGYRARLLGAAYRHLGHWYELVGGDLVLSMPYEWAVKANASDVEVRDRINDPVRPEIVQALYDRIPDFRCSYDEDGMTPADFDTFGATVRTLRAFIEAVHDVTAIVRDFMLPNPDVRKT
jgi:transaldolase